MACKDSQKFRTSEASSKAALRTQGAIDEFLNIKNLIKFRELNIKWSKAAQEKYGIEGKLFIEDERANRVYANKAAFKRIDNSKGIFYQKEEGPISSSASSQTISKLKEFLNSIGVRIEDVRKIVVDGKQQDANSIALLTQKLIQVIEGKETVSLPEEAMHFAVAIIKQTNPSLYKKMMSEVNSYKMLNDVFATYGTDPLYQTKEGKPDVIALKEEAIGKILAETVIRKAEGVTEKPELLERTYNWWQAILNWLKSLVVKSGFDKAAMDILSGEKIGTVEDIREEEGRAFLQKSVQDSTYDNIKAVSKRMKLEDDSYYIDGRKISRRVTNFAKSWYEKMNKNKELTKTEYQKALSNMKQDVGTKGHEVIKYAYDIFIDENGYPRQEPLSDDDFNKKFPGFDRAIYEILRDNLKDRIESFPEGTRFMSEVSIYNPRTDVAGTFDFLAIKPDGKVSVLDWKFIGLDVERYEDLPWYDIKAWRMQMEQYKLILQSAYGVKPQDFEQTRMIPIRAEYTKGNERENILPKLKSVEIGEVDPSKITKDYLLPLSLVGERTGEEGLDKLIEKLNAVYDNMTEQIVSPEDRREKSVQLNALFKAIRHLQIKRNITPLIQESKILNERIKRIIKRYEDNFKGKDPTAFSEKTMNDFAREMLEAGEALNVYVTMDEALDDIAGSDEELRKDLRDTAYAARMLNAKLNSAFGEFVDKTLGGSEGITNLLKEEKVIKGFTRWFATTSTIQMSSVELLFKKTTKQLTYAAQDTLNENLRLKVLKDNYEAWARRKGLSKKNYFDIIKKKDKNELIDEFSGDFYSLLKKKTEEKDYGWIQDNIDAEEYSKFLEEQLEKDVKRILERPQLDKADQDKVDNALKNGWRDADLPFDIRRQIDQLENLYSISGKESAGWLIRDFTIKFPLKKWTSKEWIELNKEENKPAKDFYDYIREKNDEYQQLDYITKRQSRVFLPFVRKDLMEKVVTGGNIRLGEQFFRDISIDEGDIGYGKQNPLTGEPVDVIPKYFVHEIDEELSTDLFKTMSFYNEAALKYKYLRDIESQMRAVLKIERNKKAIATSMFAKTVRKDDGTVELTLNNDENSDLLQSMMRAIIYGQKYVASETFDQILGKIGKWGETFNRKLGINIFPEGYSERQVSMNKILTQLNNIFQLNTLGLNILSASSNLFGGSMHSIINAGRYYTREDYAKAELTLIVNKLTGTDKKKMIGALEYFLPLTDNYNRELHKRLSVTRLTSENLQDFLMYFMRKGDWAVQMSNFYAYLNNTIVQDGELVNVREYLRSLPKYKGMRYQGTAAQREALKKEFENDVKALIEEKGVMKVATIEDDKFIIPGIEQKSPSVVKVTQQVRELSSNALGNLSENNLRMINLNVYGKSFMVFKNWIPRLVDVRMGNMKYDSALDAYEWGRTRMIFRILLKDTVHSLGALRNSFLANDKGIEYMRNLFEQKRAEYEDDTGKTLNMTEEEFIDLVRSNIRNQMVDVIFLCTLMSMVMAIKAIPPDDDEDPSVKNTYRFMLRAVDKFKDELTYFYDPTSFVSIASSGVFPVVTLIDNFTKGLINFGKENWALFTDNEDDVKNTQVIKYWMKTFPFTNQMIGYMPMFFPEVAKDLGVRIQSNYGIRR